MRDSSAFIGKHLGSYQVTTKIACGSFGCVYLARHTLLTNRTAAIKVIHTKRFYSNEELENFRREAEILVMLDHPHILRIYDFGIDEDEGLPFLVMEYAPNGSLRNLLKRHAQHRLPLAQALLIIKQVGEALFYAHQQNIVHRDLKPENILLNLKGEALLADFSIAIIQNTTNNQNQLDVIGTPPYMAPEQFDGRVTRRSDQYSLGCLSYELLTGHKPFLAIDLGTMRYKHKHEKPVPPTQLNPLLPLHIEQAVLKTMEKRRLNRFSNVSFFILALDGPSFPQLHPPSVSGLSQMNKWQWLAKGIQLRKLQRYEAAIEADDQAILLDFNFALAHNNRGVSLYYLKRHREALAAYEQAILLDPYFALPYHNRATILFDLGNYEEALVDYEQAIYHNQRYVTAYYGKGNVLYHLERYREALAAYEYAMHLDPKFALPYYGMGNTLFQLGLYLEALDAYESAIQIDIIQAKFYLGKGKVLQQLSRIEEAQLAFERWEKIDRDE